MSTQNTEQQTTQNRKGQSPSKMNGGSQCSQFTFLGERIQTENQQRKPGAKL